MRWMEGRSFRSEYRITYRQVTCRRERTRVDRVPARSSSQTITTVHEKITGPGENSPHGSDILRGPLLSSFVSPVIVTVPVDAAGTRSARALRLRETVYKRLQDKSSRDIHLKRKVVLIGILLNCQCNSMNNFCVCVTFLLRNRGRAPVPPVCGVPTACVRPGSSGLSLRHPQEQKRSCAKYCRK